MRAHLCVVCALSGRDHDDPFHVSLDAPGHVTTTHAQFFKPCLNKFLYIVLTGAATFLPGLSGWLWFSLQKISILSFGGHPAD